MPRTPSRRARFRLSPIALIALLAAVPTARGDFTSINFDTTPALPVAPTTFSAPRQDLLVAGLATVSGGTPVSTPSNLASFGPGGGARNAYGTRSGTTFGYLQNLAIDFAPGNTVTRVQGTLFNGFPDLNSYTVTIFNGGTQVGTASLVDLPDNSSSTAFASWDLSAASITRLVITPDTTFSGGAWNYFIDNVGVTFVPVPEPSSLAALTLGLAVLASRLRARTRS